MKTCASFIVTGEINLPYKHCCATLNIYSRPWSVAQQHTEYTLLRFHYNNGYANSLQYYAIRTLPVLTILGTFARSAYCNLKFVRDSICPHVSARFPLDGFLWNLVLGTVIKISREISGLVKIIPKYRALYMETQVCCIVAGDIKPP